MLNDWFCFAYDCLQIVSEIQYQYRLEVNISDRHSVDAT